MNKNKTTPTTPTRPNTTRTPFTETLAGRFIAAAKGLHRATADNDHDTLPAAPQPVDPDRLAAIEERMSDIEKTVADLSSRLGAIEKPAGTPAPETPQSAARAFWQAVAAVKRERPDLSDDAATAEAARRWPALHAATIHPANADLNEIHTRRPAK